jgi:hypothetical protein
MRFTPQKVQIFEFVIAVVEGRIAGACYGASRNTVEDCV